MPQPLELPWGDGRLRLDLPDRWKILGELKPKGMAAVPEPSEACARALSQPIGSARLSSRDLANKRILIVADDHSRPTPVNLFIRPILDELFKAGASAGNIEFLIATGVHRASRLDEMEKKLGADIISSYSVRCHNAYDSANLVDLGVTARGTRIFLNKLLLEADLIVCVGAVEPHLLLGFGGGFKMIIPGCAGADTIGKNHLQGVDPDHFDYVGVRGKASPMRLDLEEGAGLLQRDVFIVNAAMNEHAQPAEFFCGHPIEAHRMGEEFVSNMVRLDVPEQSDVVIANSCPMDVDLRQSLKCIGNSLYACKAGGMMIGLARAVNGLGEIPLAKKTLPYQVMRTLLKIIGKKRVLPLVEKAKQGEPVEEVFIGHFGLQMLRRNDLVIFSDNSSLPPDIGRKMGIARSFNDVSTMMNWAAAKAPREATVWVFPFGGSTYATVGEG